MSSIEEPTRRRGTTRAAFSRRAVLLVAVLLFAGRASADSAEQQMLRGTTPEQRATAQTDYLKTKLGLSGDAASRVADINLDTAKKMEPVLKGDLNPMSRLSQGQAIQQERDTDLQKVLTPDQFQTYLASKNDMRQKVEDQLAAQVKAAGGTTAPAAQ